MIFTNPFQPADVARAHPVQINAKMYASARFESVRALHAYREVYLKPIAQGMLQKTPRENVLLGLHYRIAALMGTARTLNAPIHFQSLAAAGRSALELGVDTALFAADKTPESVQRVEAFDRVEKMKLAQTISTYYRSRPDPLDFSIAEHKGHAGNGSEQSAVAGFKTQYWAGGVSKRRGHGRKRAAKRRWPDHWSKLGDLRSRAHAAKGKWEEYYVRHYTQLSWQVHGGVVGINGLSPVSFTIIAANAYGLIHDAVLETYRILGKELSWSATPHWYDRLNALGDVAGLCLLEQQLQSLGEPPRYDFLEQAEHAVGL